MVNSTLLIQRGDRLRTGHLPAGRPDLPQGNATIQRPEQVTHEIPTLVHLDHEAIPTVPVVRGHGLPAPGVRAAAHAPVVQHIPVAISPEAHDHDAGLVCFLAGCHGRVHPDHHAHQLGHVMDAMPVQLATLP